jgi:hypothetical protein
MGTMGFLPQPGVREGKAVDADRMLFTFDSGQGISFGEARMHTIVTGSTGSGKTSNFILPAVNNLLKAGFAGLIVDIKGNMTDQIRALARLHGREGDILEIGTGPGARPVNLLEGLDENEVLGKVKAMTYGGLKALNSTNDSFIMAGVSATAEIIRMCMLLGKKEPEFAPTIATVAEMLNDYSLCAGVYNYFLRVIDDMDSKCEEKILAARIRNNVFHPCCWTAEKRPKDYDQQVEWAMRTSRFAFTEFAQTPGVNQGFCGHGCRNLYLATEIYTNNRIILLRFDTTSGRVAESLSRHYLEAYYAAVFHNGLYLPEGRYTFAVIDEFQDIVSLAGGNPYNDARFTAKAREFRNILILGTQSFSALGNRSEANVEALVNNCNNKVMLYCEDPWTQEVAARHIDADLCHMEPGEALVIRFDAEDRRHVRSRESMLNAFTATREALNGLEAKERMPPVLVEEQNTVQKLLERIAGQERIGEETMCEQTMNNVRAQAGETPERQPRIVAEFPEFFKTAISRNTYDELFLPAGWENLAEKAFMRFRESGLPLDIRRFLSMEKRLLAVAEDEGPRSAAKYTIGLLLLNQLMEGTRHTCMICGEDTGKGDAVLCRKCSVGNRDEQARQPAEKADRALRW